VNIELHIERLILEGFSLSRPERALIQEAVEGELARLLAESGLSPTLTAGTALGHLQAGAIQLSSGNNPTALGQQIANSVYGGIGE
jgi:hypothetical protein